MKNLKFSNHESRYILEKFIPAKLSKGAHVIVTGSSGSGKDYFADKLSEIINQGGPQLSRVQIVKLDHYGSVVGGHWAIDVPQLLTKVKPNHQIIAIGVSDNMAAVVSAFLQSRPNDEFVVIELQPSLSLWRKANLAKAKTVELDPKKAEFFTHLRWMKQWFIKAFATDAAAKRMIINSSKRRLELIGEVISNECGAGSTRCQVVTVINSEESPGVVVKQGWHGVNAKPRKVVDRVKIVKHPLRSDDVVRDERLWKSYRGPVICGVDKAPDEIVKWFADIALAYSVDDKSDIIGPERFAVHSATPIGTKGLPLQPYPRSIWLAASQDGKWYLAYHGKDWYSGLVGGAKQDINKEDNSNKGNHGK